MKRIFSFLLVLALLPAVHAYALEPLRAESIAIAAPAAILMEKETGTVLYEKNADERMPPASVTKIMTLLLILEEIDAGRLRLEDTVTASARAASFGGSCVYLEQGEQMSVDEMLKCIAVVSANDCAVAMAEHLSGTEEIFVERMNRRAAELGLENTHFTNCTGLFDDDTHYSTARDIAVMSRELLRHPLIKDYSTIWMDSIRGGEFGLTNTNKLVNRYEGCTGLKTGFTSKAMYCLSASAERDGVEYIAVILHGDSIDSRNTDATTLLNYAFANFTLLPLRQSAPLPPLPVDGGEAGSVALSYGETEAILLPRNAGQPAYRLELPGSVPAPVRLGQKLGTLSLRAGEQELARVPILAAADVGRITFFGIFTRLAGSLVGL